jgi:serine/threonine-protein kinase
LHHLQASLKDRYQFRAILGKGASGTVFEVANLALGRLEALKTLSDWDSSSEGATRFKGEARIAASLDHPRIVKVYEFGQVDEILWYTMQRVDGPTLGALIHGGRVLDGEELARIAIPILDALAYSQERGVIHRDIKPANILFSLQGRPFLTDYGIAKAVENPLDTRTGQLLGTPAFVAPEQALGKPVDARADLYSLGAALYQAAAGRLPFPAEGILQTLLLRLKEEPPSLLELCPGLEPAVAGAIMRALRLDREARFASASDMRAELVRACAAAGLAWDRPLAVADFRPVRTPLPRAQAGGAGEATADLPRPRRHLGWAAAALALGLAALYGFRQRPPRMATPPLAATAGSVPAQEPTAPPLPPVLRASPRPQPPVPEPAPLPRRPVVYPQLLGDGLATPTGKDCAGRSVDVSLLVGEDGRVKSCKVLSTVEPACAEAARNVAMRYRFKAALDAQGQPVQATVAVAVEFPEAP